ncbi:peroxidasin homolog [Glandiceps talaboti]
MGSRGLLLLLFLLVLPSICWSCPNRCLCFRTTVRCMHLMLDHIPEVPATTTILDLRFNRIEDVPPGSFQYLPDLNTLLLNNNNIKRIANGAFQGLDNLKYLYLYKNEIEEIESDAFNGLESLEQLYLYFNNLQHLEPDTFSDLPSMERLFLHNNQLSLIRPGTFSNLKSLKRLRLDSNNLMCDCQILWLAEMMRNARNSGNTQSAATCHEPVNLRGRQLVTVSVEELDCIAPEFVAEPDDVDATYGNQVFFSCKATGDPKPAITWLHNNEVIDVTVNTEKYNLLADGTLMIYHAEDVDEGTYECMARNAAGEAKTDPAELRYLGEPSRPAFTYRPEDTEIRESESAVLHCSATGYPRPVIVWKKHDQILPEDERYRISPGGSLQIFDVRRRDEGAYQCEAVNSVDSVSASARLIVLIPPSFEVRPSDQDVIEGRTAEFQCRARGNPQPVIAWTREDGTALPNDRRHTELSDGTLRIARVTDADEGSYECRAINTAGHRRTVASLSVSRRIPPVFLVTPTDIDIQTGSDAQIPCSANGDPPPTITWSKDGIQISESSKFYISPEGYLSIRDVGSNDQGRYECSARNSIGFASTSMQLNVIVLDDRNYRGDNIVNESIKMAINSVDRAINSTQSALFDKSKPRTPNDLLSLFRFPTPEAVEIARAAEVFERTLEIIHDSVQRGMKVNLSNVEYSNKFNDLVSPHHLEVIANLSGCTAHHVRANCSDMCFHQKYRTADGTCNNLQHPMWGSALAPFNRLLKPIYENGFNTPVGWNQTQLYNNYQKPSARLVSLHVASSRDITEHKKFTHMLMQWGQFVDHDLDFAVLSPSKVQFIDGVKCDETCENQPPCFPIPIPEGDPRITRRRCMEFTRSSAVCGSGSTSVFFNTVMPREQINQITSYIDASNIYGSSKSLANLLRDFATEKGHLRTGNIVESSGKPLLPFNRDTPIDCLRDASESPVPCFLAGDHRANEQLALLSMHTLWLREHNRVATELLNLNPHWDDDTIYHEARKIVGAQLQHITYIHWLPKILGPRGLDIMDKYNGYDPNTDGSIINAFAAAAFRFGHGLINPMIFRFNSTFQPIPEGNLPLHKAFFSPYRVVDEGGIDPILRGLFGSPAKELSPNEVINTELTEHLFQMAHTVALDLAALNLQRGRDHAIPGYNDWRVLCNMSAATTFDDLRKEISDENVREKLELLYRHPGNIDLWIAGMVEDALPDGLLGPTFTCILAKQFQRTRNGDRFWYENPGVFTPAQLTQIKQTSLAKILCDNGDHIERVQKDVFLKAEYPTGYLKCEDLPGMDLRVWTDCCEDCKDSDKEYLVTQIFRSKRSEQTSPASSKHSKLHKTIISSSQQKAGKTKDRKEENHVSLKSGKTTPSTLEKAVVYLTDMVTELQQTVKDLSGQVRELQEEKETTN